MSQQPHTFGEIDDRLWLDHPHPGCVAECPVRQAEIRYARQAGWVGGQLSPAFFRAVSHSTAFCPPNGTS